MNIKVIDISSWQTNVDFKKVKKSGVKAVMIRTGYYGKEDTQFKNHITGAIGAGLDIGVYTYIMASNIEQAREEAKQTLAIIEPYKEYINYPVWADIEDEKYYTNFTTTNRTDILITFLTTIAEAGYYVGIYTNPSWLNNYLNYSRLKNYDIWLAAWTYNPKTPSKFINSYNNVNMWQWGTDTVNGVYGEVDADFSFVDYPAITKNRVPANDFSKPVKWCGLSLGRAARRKDCTKNAAIVSRCEKGKYYPFIKSIKVDGKTWLQHQDETYSMLQDGGYLFTLYNYENYKVTANLLNVRNRPNGDILGTVPKDTILVGLKLEDNWLKIEYKNTIAYVHSNYVTKA